MPSKKVNPIEVANLKSIGDFITEYLPPGEKWKTWIHPRTKDEYEVSLQTPKALSEPDFEACFHLIEFNSSTDYKNSKDGWKPRSKRKEMKLLDLKYLLVKRDSNVEGFVSLMPTYEDGYPVMYCYEIHLSPALQGNVRGVKFYERLGYAKDEFSPPPKVLRNGTKVEAEYVILSKDRR
ncbi:hypothetical protein BGZ57DRAFT_940063 [Hyaloscypha finlandica]|nr:hypothetical protein BGZ57DRAFT_940063 [Hyaloscypha finlandica]